METQNTLYPFKGDDMPRIKINRSLQKLEGYSEGFKDGHTQGIQEAKRTIGNLEAEIQTLKANILIKRETYNKVVPALKAKNAKLTQKLQKRR